MAYDATVFIYSGMAFVFWSPPPPPSRVLLSQVHARLLDNPAASPFWLKPHGDVDDPIMAVQSLSTPLHDAARTGRYELLSMMLHHSRGRGLLPAACLTLDGNGERYSNIIYGHVLHFFSGGRGKCELPSRVSPRLTE